MALEFVKENKKVELRELKLNGNVAWDLELPVLTQNDDHPEECTSPTQIQLIRNRREKCTAFYECPGCHAPEPSNCKAFQYEDLDIKHQCILCGKKSSVKEWRCVCRKLWHTCRIHRYAKATDLTVPTIAHAASGQTPPEGGPDGKRAKVKATGSDLGRTPTDDISAGIHNNKRKQNKFDKPENDQDDTLSCRPHLKRKRNPDDLVTLGSIDNPDKLDLNFLTPALKRRFYGTFIG